ncbi:MAG: WS/DGAT/MGAT family O-acyltransferase [Nocardioidaceae bacterium]
MRQLSSLDAQFLHVESWTTTGHVGGLLLLDPSTAPDKQLTLDGLRAVLEPRLHLAAPLRQRLVEVPLGLGLPYWVDDPGFDLEFHLREVALPGDGTEEQLAEQLAWIHSRPLDRARPLWEIYLVHNVEGGRCAVYAKVHHAAIDGVTGAEILATILDFTPEPRLVDPAGQAWQPRLPSVAERAVHVVTGAVRQPLTALRTLPRSLPHVGDVPVVGQIPGAKVVGDLAGALARLAGWGGHEPHPGSRVLHAPRTPLNARITAHRRFAFGSLPLQQVKRVKDAFGVTVNDVVMALVTSALRRWLLDHDGLPPGPIVVAVPVSIRGQEAAGDGGNQVSVMAAEMPTHKADARVRLQLVAEAMDDAKQHFEAVPATILQDLSAAVPTALSGLASRALFRLVTAPGPPFNLFVSNVPGPQAPLYVGGARVLGIYPASGVSDLTGGLNITLFSYDGALDFGLIACREVVPDLWHLIDYLRDALDELLALDELSAPNAP